MEEITLEKVEQVKEKTGVSYREAKEALEASGGSVVDAIIAIEDAVNVKSRSKVDQDLEAIVDFIKNTIKKGNVSKIVIAKDGETLLNLPVNVGIVGTVFAPWVAVAGVIAAFGTRCSIRLIKDNGEVVDVNKAACGAAANASDKFATLTEKAAVKGEQIIEDIKDKLNR